MIFKPKTKYDDCNIIIDGMNLAREHVTKFLGVLVDDKLSWNDHISSVCKKVSKNISVLYKIYSQK